MDEEEQRRNASAAAFGEADNQAEQNFMLQERTRVEDSARKRLDSAWANAKASIQNAVNAPYGTKRYDESGKNLDTQAALYDKAREESSMARAAWEEMQIDPSGAKGTRYPFAGQWERERGFGQGGNVNVAAEAYKLLLPDSTVPPAAASAFSQLDAPAPGPLDYDPATAAGLSQETQDAFRRNWDENLAAARKAIEGNGPGREERDALAIYTDQLVRMADDYQANRNRVDRAQAPADHYAAQRQREAAVGKRMAEYDVFSSPTAQVTLFTPDTARTNTYDRIMRDKSGKEVFDYFM